MHRLAWLRKPGHAGIISITRCCWCAACAMPCWPAVRQRHPRRPRPMAGWAPARCGLNWPRFWPGWISDCHWGLAQQKLCCYNCALVVRSVAQPGSASAWGAEGRWFESTHSDQIRKSRQFTVGFFHVCMVCRRIHGNPGSEPLTKPCWRCCATFPYFLLSAVVHLAQDRCAGFCERR